MRNRFWRRIAAGALTPVLAGHATAVVTGVEWRSVDNSAATPGTHGWTEGSRTFDLFILGAVGDIVNGASAGGDGDPTFGIRVTPSTVYNHPLGGNTRSPNFELFPTFESLRFDTFCSFESAASANTPGSASGVATSFFGTADLIAADGRISFSSFSQPPPTMAADSASTTGGSMRVLRVTVSATCQELGGTDSKIRVAIGTAVGQHLDFDVPNALAALPPPGAFALDQPAYGAACLIVSPPPALTWSASDFALNYELQVSLDPAFQTMHYAAPGLTVRTHTPPLWVIDRGHTYYWRVIARNVTGERLSSPGVAFFSTVFAGDVDQNGSVLFPDLNFVLSSYGSTVGGLLYNPQIDLNHDGAINFQDLNIVLSNLRRVCAP